MPPEQDVATPDDRHERILDATESLIGQLGYDRVRLIDVAEEAGVSIGSLQHRFRNREGLLRAAVDRADTRERERWIALAQGVTEPWDRLLRLIESVLTMDQDANAEGLWLELNAASRRTTGLREILQGQNDMWADAFAQAAAEGLASGRLSSPLSAEDAGLALLGLIDGFYVARHTGSVHHDAERITRIAKTVASCIFEVHDLDGTP
jgi:AcrR family transcriptional regulator